MKKLILALLLISCADDYMTIERNVIDADNKVPIYFYAQAEPLSPSTWRPVFTYLIYFLEEGEYDM